MYLGLRKPATCLRCGASDLRRLIWGRPSAEGWKEIDAERAIPAGCSTPPYPPSWRCRACGNEWRDLTDPAQQELDASEARLRDLLLARHRR